MKLTVIVNSYNTAMKFIAVLINKLQPIKYKIFG